MTFAQTIVDVQGLELTPEDKELLEHPSIAGLILFARNYESKAQLLALTRAVHAINPQLMICVDQEGGRVQRFRRGFTELSAMNVFGKRYLADPQLAIDTLKQQLITMIHALQEVGVTATLMPVVDVDYGRSDIIGERSFGRDPLVITQLASTVIDTLHEFGMPATLKHFPGHGFVKVDSHLDLPIDERPFNEIKNNDLVPFAKLLHKADYLMPAHIIYSEVDNRPVGFSPVWIKDILRGEMGYTGKIITDDLSMQGAAVWGDYAGRAQAAIDAGCDLLLVCNNRDGAYQVVEMLEDQ